MDLSFSMDEVVSALGHYLPVLEVSPFGIVLHPWRGGRIVGGMGSIVGAGVSRRLTTGPGTEIRLKVRINSVGMNPFDGFLRGGRLWSAFGAISWKRAVTAML